MKMNDTSQRTRSNPLMELATEKAQQIRSQISSRQNTNSSKASDKNSFDSQGLVNVNCIKSGIVCCADGSYVKILEVIPLNYYQKDVEEKNKITESFMYLFRTCPNNLHIKLRTEKADINAIAKKIRDNCRKEKNPVLTRRAEDYISHIRMLQSDNTIATKFYVIFAYDGENGKYSKDFDGSLNDDDVIKLAGISRNSFYKYKREIREEIAL